MLAQVICAHVHELHRVERAAPQLRLDARVRGNAVKMIEHLDIRKRRSAADAGFRIGMPAHRRVQGVKHTVARHKRLARATLFRRAAEIDDRTGMTACLQIVLRRDGSAERRCAEQIVPAAVTVALSVGARLGHARLLPQLFQRVKFAQNADDRLSASVACGKRRSYPGKPARHSKALARQHCAKSLRRAELQKRRFGMIPQIICGLDQLRALFINDIYPIKLHDLSLFSCDFPKRPVI